MLVEISFWIVVVAATTTTTTCGVHHQIVYIPSEALAQLTTIANISALCSLSIAVVIVDVVLVRVPNDRSGHAAVHACLLVRVPNDMENIRRVLVGLDFVAIVLTARVVGVLIFGRAISISTNVFGRAELERSTVQVAWLNYKQIIHAYYHQQNWGQKLPGKLFSRF